MKRGFHDKEITMKKALLILALCILAGIYARATQIDTNATTTVTGYVPGRVGEVLIGKTGGTTTVWIASGQTTNGWTKVSN